MPGKAEFSPEHPAARIRAKLEQRRVLEARFLLRQFSDEIDAGQRQALEQEVKRLLAEVERLRHQARTAAVEGRREEAGKLYRDIEQLVVDVPGLPEERAALAGAEAVFYRLSAQDLGAVPPVPMDVPLQASGREVRESEPLDGAAAAAQERQQAIAQAVSEMAAMRQARRPRRFLGLWLAVAGCAGIALALLLIWQSRPKELAASPPVSPVQTSAHDIVIEPARSGDSTSPATPPPPPPEIPVSATANPQPSPSQEPAPPPPDPEPIAASPPPTESELTPVSPPQTEPLAEQAVVPPATDPQPTFKLGTLQVKRSKRK